MKTIDVCQLAFPFVSYGESLAQAEKTIQQIREIIFREDSGLLRSGVIGHLN